MGDRLRLAASCTGTLGLLWLGAALHGWTGALVVVAAFVAVLLEM